jgi:hypothetical protein
MSFTYGYDLKDGDKILEAPSQLGEILSPLLIPGGALINNLPFCTIFNFHPCNSSSVSRLFSVRHIPSWVPFLSYEPLARIVRKLSKRIRNEPIDFVRNALVCGDHAPGIHINRHCMP